jgi:hypothetical protein
VTWGLSHWHLGSAVGELVKASSVDPSSRTHAVFAELGPAAGPAGYLSPPDAEADDPV